MIASVAYKKGTVGIASDLVLHCREPSCIAQGRYHGDDITMWTITQLLSHWPSILPTGNATDFGRD
jgi:hypothetical protein